jgi:hypothetical protein
VLQTTNAVHIEWRRRKPKWEENPPPLKACRFDSDLGHHSTDEDQERRWRSFFLCFSTVKKTQRMTYKLAQELGGHVRKGEHGSLVVYADTITRLEENGKGEEIEHSTHFMKGYTAFNAEQIEGLPGAYYDRPEPKGEPMRLIEARANPPPHRRFFECEFRAAMFANTLEALRHVIDVGPPSGLGGDLVEVSFRHTPAFIADDVNGTPPFRQSGERSPAGAAFSRARSTLQISSLNSSQLALGRCNGDA